ncbi:MAG: YdeI/OmpD-associated family protein, partial [Bacteroidota bacterium]
LGDVNFYIIIAKKHLDSINKKLGEEVYFKIEEDPDQLGVEMPEVLTVFLEQDSASKSIFDTLTNGKKRSLIYRIIATKDLDAKVKTILTFLQKSSLQRNRNYTK